MSRAIGQYFSKIREQRAILNEFADFELDITDSLIARLVASFDDARNDMEKPDPQAVKEYAHHQFDLRMKQYHANLDIAERRLKTAAAIGGVVDISNIAVGHDIRIIAEPIHAEATLADKQRARDNLLAMDFYDRLARMPDDGCHASKLTIVRLQRPDPKAAGEANAKAFEAPVYQSVVLGSFESKADAMLYRLAAE